MRLYGELADHPASVVTPLLLPDAPVVAWWPARGAAPAEDPIGGLAQRRITDSSGDDDPMRALRARCASYAPGDTDLAWTRATTWRTILAASLDQPYDPISSVKVSQDGRPTGELLAAWLGSRLDVPSSVQSSPGPGITEVELAMNGPASCRPDPTGGSPPCPAQTSPTEQWRCRGGHCPSCSPRNCAGSTRTRSTRRRFARCRLGVDRMSASTVIVHRDEETLAQAVAARLITRLVDGQVGGRFRAWC